MFLPALGFIEGFVALNVEKALAEILALDKFATRGLSRQDYENLSLRQKAMETLIGMHKIVLFSYSLINNDCFQRHIISCHR